jgi:stress-induced morphogen
MQIMTKIQPTPTVVEIVDNSDGVCNGAKLEILVVSEAFQDVPLLKRHRMVNECLQDMMDDIHALSLKTWTPSQFESQK